MPLTTDSIREAVVSLYPDNLRNEISAKDMRDGMRLVADVIDAQPADSFWSVITEAQFVEIQDARADVAADAAQVEADRLATEAARDEVLAASQVLRAQFVTVGGQTFYPAGVGGVPAAIIEDGHILFGASPFGPLTYGVDYSVDGGIQFTFDPGEGSLFHLVTMPRFTNSEAQVILQDLADAVEASGLTYPTRAEAVAALPSLPLSVQKVSWNSGVGVIDVARKVGATDIPDMLGWVPSGVATPEHYGAIGNGVSNDTAALNAWGGQAGRGMLRGTYRVTANIQVARNRVDATGAVIIYDGAGYGRMVDMTTTGARWAGGELDGNFKASVGIYSTAGGCVVDGAEIHGLRSLVEQCSGVWMVGPNGGTARNCEIYDLSAVGDGSYGDSNGPSRAVLMTSPTAMTAPFIIEDNEARDIAGEEGDAYQVMANNGTYPFLSAAWSIIRRNTARGFNRRGIKIQASDVICEDNILIAPTATAGLGPQSVIDVIAANNVIVRRNFTVSAPGMRAIGIAKPPAAPKMTGIVIEGNIHNGVADADSITIDGVSQAIVNGNVHISGRRALYIVNSEQTAIRGNIAANSVTDGTYSDFEIADTNTRMLVEGNVSLGGTKYASVGAKSSLSIFRNTTSLRPVGAVIATTSTAVNSMITGTVAMTSSGVAVAGLSEAHTAISDSIQLGTIGGSLSNKLIWTTGDPATKRAGRFHTVGDVAWNAAGLSPVGWKCTASGTPGTWAAF